MMDRRVITMEGSLAETGCLEEEEVLEGQEAVEEDHQEAVIVGEVMMTEEVEGAVVEEAAGAVAEEAAGPVVVVVPEEVLMIG